MKALIGSLAGIALLATPALAQMSNTTTTTSAKTTKTTKAMAPKAKTSVAKEAKAEAHQLLERFHLADRAGAEVVALEIPAVHPALRTAGRLDPNDPMVQEWLEIMAENRRKADEDPDYL